MASIEGIGNNLWISRNALTFLLHSFAHAVIRQLAVECGYNTASIGERIYSRSPQEDEPMAGVLIYMRPPTVKARLAGYAPLVTRLGSGDTWIRPWRL